MTDPELLPFAHRLRYLALMHDRSVRAELEAALDHWFGRHGQELATLRLLEDGPSASPAGAASADLDPEP